MGDKFMIPRGCMVRYREWYGAQKPNVGLKLHAEVVADGIVSRETKGEVSYGVLDPAAFAEDRRQIDCGSHGGAQGLVSDRLITLAWGVSVRWAAGTRCAHALLATATANR